MTTIYKRPTDDVTEALARALDLPAHESLVYNEVDITLIVAFGTPAIRVHGWTALALTRVVNLRHRVEGLGDVEIVVDGDVWPTLTERERLALLDHELTHVVVVEKDGEVQLDKAGRPKIKLRLHDRQFGWFDDVAQRNGIASQEVQQARRFAEDAGQLYLFDGPHSDPPHWPRRRSSVRRPATQIHEVVTR
jgi:hypothetical protein